MLHAVYCQLFSFSVIFTRCSKALKAIQAGSASAAFCCEVLILLLVKRAGRQEHEAAVQPGAGAYIAQV
eukprot:837231-Amphidinium_carterae.1